MNEKQRLRREDRERSDAEWYPKGRWAAFRCFWTWPFGHYFKYEGDYENARCVGCSKKADPYSGLM